MRRLVLGCLALGLASLAVPFLLVPLPPVVDYPNHLARLWLIAGGAGQAPFDGIYAVDWSRAVTNIGIDLAAAALAPLVPVEILARVLLALSLLLPVAGALALARVLAGRWHALHVLFPLIAWNFCFAMGFMNQQIAVGMAMLAAAGEAALQRLPPGVAFVARILLAVAIGVVHPFGALAYGGLLGAWALGHGSSWPRRILRATGAGLPALAVVGLLFLVSPETPGIDAQAMATGRDAWVGGLAKAWAIMSPFATYQPVIETLAAIVLLMALGVAAARGALRGHPGFLCAGVGLVMLALVAPHHIGDTTHIDFRVACLALPVLLVGLAPRRAEASAWRVVAAVLLVMTIARSAWIGSVWWSARSDIASVQEAIAEVPTGARLLPVMDQGWPELVEPRPWRRVLWHHSHGHYPFIATRERLAFVPYLFSAAGKQPIRVLPPFSGISAPDGTAARLAWLAGNAAHDSPVPHYVRDWRANFDFVLLLNRQPTTAMPDGLDLEVDAGFAQLWRVVRR